VRSPTGQPHGAIGSRQARLLVVFLPALVACSDSTVVLWGVEGPPPDYDAGPQDVQPDQDGWSPDTVGDGAGNDACVSIVAPDRTELLVRDMDVKVTIQLTGAGNDVWSTCAPGFPEIEVGKDTEDYAVGLEVVDAGRYMIAVDNASSGQNISLYTDPCGVLHYCVPDTVSAGMAPILTQNMTGIVIVEGPSPEFTLSLSWMGET
jgi:hypothetical protein